MKRPLGDTQKPQVHHLNSQQRAAVDLADDILRGAPDHAAVDRSHGPPGRASAHHKRSAALTLGLVAVEQIGCQAH